MRTARAARLEEMTVLHIDRTRALEAFNGYVAPYDADNPRIALKVAHTLRVADVCDAIARDEGLGDEDRDLAWLCGLLHDLGRFEQLRRWDTFDDSCSASHAALGVRELFESGPEAAGSIRRFSPSSEEDGLIREAVGQHSALRVDDRLDARTRLFCDLVRDADKIDILRVASESSVQTILGIDEHTFLDSGISDGARRAFAERRCVARSERTEPADFLVGLMGFIFELRFAASLRLVREQGYLYRILDDPFGLGRPFADPATQTTWGRMCAEMRELVEKDA